MPEMPTTSTFWEFVAPGPTGPKGRKWRPMLPLTIEETHKASNERRRAPGIARSENLFRPETANHRYFHRLCFPDWRILPTPEGFPGTGSVYEIDDGTFAPVHESSELAKVWRGHVVVHRVEIAVICDVQRVHTQPNVMRLSFA